MRSKLIRADIEFDKWLGRIENELINTGKLNRHNATHPRMTRAIARSKLIEETLLNAEYKEE